MRIAIIRQPKQRLSKTPTRQLPMHAIPTVLAQRIRQLQRVQLDVGVPVCEPLDHGCDGVFGA